MKKAILTIMAVLAMALATVLTVVSPSSAATTGNNCRDLGRGVRTCVAVTWQTSDMTITSITLTTPQNCGNLETSGRYRYFDASDTNAYYHTANTGCTVSYGVYDQTVAGATTRGVQAAAHANINNGPDWDLTWDFSIRKNGTYAVNMTALPGDCC